MLMLILIDSTPYIILFENDIIMIFSYLYKHRYAHTFHENKQQKCLVLNLYLYMKDYIISLNDFCRFEHLHFITHDTQHLQSLQLHIPVFSQSQVPFIFIRSLSSLLFFLIRRMCGEYDISGIH